MSETRRHPVRWATGLLLLALVVSGCRAKDDQKKAVGDRGTRTEDMSWGPVKILVTADPAKVDLTRDVVLTFEVTAPAEVDVTIPPLEGRAEGFSVGGSFDDEPATQDGKVTRVRHVRLVPGIADRYRLSPLAVTYVDRSTSPPTADWFPTRPIVFGRTGRFEGQHRGDIDAGLKPVWVYPPFKTVALWTGAVLAAIAALVLGWKLLRRIHRTVQLARMSPRERALRELDSLLAKDLPSRELTKQFYLELTMIVRRYIERQHRVRAPEQTTEEFLAAVAEHPRFGATVVEKLRSFLQAADLVKFAAYHPDGGVIDKATGTAREYIVTDAPAEES